MQQMYGNYTRSYQTGDPLSDVKTGWIWDNAGDRCQPLRPNEISGHPGTAPARGSR